MTRWGVIGTGGIARRFVNDLQYSDDGVAVAVGSRSLSSAESFADQFGIARRYGSYAGLVEDSDVDVVYVATPHPAHHANARLALEAGKPVLVEKAFTMNAAEALDLATLARERGLFAMEAMWTRFLPHVRQLREIVAAGRLGEIVSIEADHGQYFPLDPEHRLFSPQLGGGALLDLGVYPVSFASMILGEPHRVTAVIEPAFTGVDGLTSMIFNYENGAQSILTCTSRAKTSTRASICGTLARIEVDGDFYAPSSFTLTDRTGERERFEFDVPGRGLFYEANEVSTCLHEGRTESLVMSLDETVSIMATMDRVMENLSSSST